MGRISRQNPSWKKPWRMTKREFIGADSGDGSMERVWKEEKEIEHGSDRVLLSTMHTKKGIIHIVADKVGSENRIVAYNANMDIVGHRDDFHDPTSFLIVNRHYRRVGIGTEIIYQGVKKFGLVRPSALSEKGYKNRERVHRRFIETALIEGKKVPQKVLNEYPDLEDKFSKIEFY